MGQCLGGTGKIAAAASPIHHPETNSSAIFTPSSNNSNTSDETKKNNNNNTTNNRHNHHHHYQNGKIQSADNNNSLAVTNASSQFVDGAYQLSSNDSNNSAVKSSSMSKNRRYFVFDRGDLIPRLNALNRSSNHSRSEGAEDNSLNLNNYQLFTKPKRNWSRYHAHLASPANNNQYTNNSNSNNNATTVSSFTSQRDDLTTPSASRCISPLSMTLSPSSPSDYYYYYTGNSNGGGGNGRSESRNTNTVASSPSSMDVFLKVPSLPVTALEGLPPKRSEFGTNTSDDRSVKAASPVQPVPLGYRNRSNTLDTVTSHPDLFRSIKESHSVTRGFDDTGYVRLNQYLLKHEIGRGSYGVVKLAYNEQDNKHYAMKVLSKKRLFRRAALQARNPKFRKNPFDPMEKLHREIAILKKLNHPNVVKLVEVLDDPNEDNLYLVFELVSHGEVLSIPTENPLTEDNAWKYFRDTVLGLEYLHFQKVIHRDIKPANLLLDDQDRIKIADFGVSNQFTGADASLSSCTGTPVFLAPELLEPDTVLRTSRHISGRAADIWSLGITLYCFFYGTVPWLDSSNPALYKKITSEPLNFPEKPTVSKSAQNLVLLMLDLDPAMRLDLAAVKEHPWVTRDGTVPMPPLVENCIQITVTDDEVTNAVKHVPRLGTLILVKYMLQKGSFRNPFHSTSTDTFTMRRQSRNSESATPGLRSSFLRDRQAPSADLTSYSPEPLDGGSANMMSDRGDDQQQHNSDALIKPSTSEFVIKYNNSNNKEVGSALMMADAGLRRAFTRTNSVPTVPMQHL